MNFLTIHRASNLVHRVIACSCTPSDTGNVRFIPASAKALGAYYNWREKNPGLCPDLGEIAARSAAVLDFITGTRKPQSKPRTDNLNHRYREPAPAQPVDRAAAIAAFITEHPGAGVHDLHEQFQCGTTAARAYLDRHAQRL
ncbi:hypothetical protein FHW75_004655 [Pseudomonas sp. OG7]|uniref:hypothetical protein n=1 Tax=Pseudomonas sp. OG7 TaxID=2587037 RepID=UPI00161C64E4|nr:hypothetical protein [Pseudomonas sp. OG7]MBB3273444.1 hypothetical protein [Pseudomonas sp. OG7]